MSDRRIISRSSLSGLVFIIITLFFPIGLSYRTEFNPDPLPDPLWIGLVFVLPVFVELDNGVWQISLWSSSLGILFPAILIGHLILSYFGYKIIKRNTNFSHILLILLVVTILEIVIFFPTFQTSWGNIPLPLALLVGLPLARLGIRPSITTPFEGMERIPENQD